MFLKTKKKKTNPILEKSDSYSKLFSRMFGSISVLERKLQVGPTDPLTAKSKKGRADRKTVGPKIFRISFPNAAEFFLGLPSMTQPGSAAVA